MNTTKYFILLGLIALVSAQIDTTYVTCPPAGIDLEYFYSDYTFYPGDETSLTSISQPDWLTVAFDTQTNGHVRLLCFGTPAFEDEGVNPVVIGWYEWNYNTGQEDLSQVFIFTVVVEEACCGDPMACNYSPDECFATGNYCFYNDIRLRS